MDGLFAADELKKRLIEGNIPVPSDTTLARYRKARIIPHWIDVSTHGIGRCAYYNDDTVKALKLIVRAIKEHGKIDPELKERLKQEASSAYQAEEKKIAEQRLSVYYLQLISINSPSAKEWEEVAKIINKFNLEESRKQFADLLLRQIRGNVARVLKGYNTLEALGTTSQIDKVKKLIQELEG